MITITILEKPGDPDGTNGDELNYIALEITKPHDELYNCGYPFSDSSERRDALQNARLEANWITQKLQERTGIEATTVDKGDIVL